jgi:hypothetical protein
MTKSLTAGLIAALGVAFAAGTQVSPVHAEGPHLAMAGIGVPGPSADEVQRLREDIRDLRTEIRDLNTRLAHLEGKR